MEYFYPNPAPAFLYSFVVGIAIGLLYDVLSVKRRLFKTHTPVVFAEDFAFCLVSFAFLTLFVLKANYGLMRWYEILCPFFSFCAYRGSLGKLNVKILSTAISFAAKIFAKVFTALVAKPVAFLLRKGLGFLRKAGFSAGAKSERRAARKKIKALEKDALHGFEKILSERE